MRKQSEQGAIEADEGRLLALLKSWTARVDGNRQHQSKPARRGDMLDTIIIMATSLDPGTRPEREVEDGRGLSLSCVWSMEAGHMHLETLSSWRGLLVGTYLPEPDGT